MSERDWTADTVAALRSHVDGVAPVRSLPSPYFTVDIRAVDESGFPAGIKYRAVRDLFARDVVSGAITEGTSLVEASGSATALAAAHFARMLKLPLTVVLPARTSPAQLARLEAYGAVCRKAERPAAMYEEARVLAEETGAHYLDYLGRAADAVDWRGNGLAVALAADDPQWIVVGVGSGVTSTTVARHLRHVGNRTTRVAVVDAENSAYFPGWAAGVTDYGTGTPSKIPGIGRPRMEPGFHGSLVDMVIPVPDGASVAAMRWCREASGVAVGPSTGANLWGVWELARIMRRDGVRGRITTVFADAGEQYADTFHDPSWVAERGFEVEPYAAKIAGLYAP
ncbi:pyridoxal-phosphate dependent enzyme [Phytomonospora endophytica]|uniref:Cysteine synthase A n=1 Tax=Phytomonospora endophytica TaxID=714109 RepID=A0A841FU00_9ACTN|nr:pyridoxal-phosphate dependent enzyme [Phytomonospora endophytica]MBB6035450.1 cysteine synthase A [Phytomonospora endophytica]GIG63797.1 cysteine synthase [Phytomonospora endophytica]